MRRLFVGAVVASLCFAACLGAVNTVRTYFVLFGAPERPASAQPIQGLVHVRTFDADNVYEKFQIVVRRSPYELRYSEANVWAVKPSQMVSDIVAKTLGDAGAFGSVTRELGLVRPRYTLAGEVYAVEVYDAEDIWQAHVAFGMRLNNFETGERYWSFTYDQRKLVETRTFSHAVRAMSELISEAMRQAMSELAALPVDRAEAPVPPPDDTRPLPATVKPDAGEDMPAPIYVPENVPEPTPE